MLTTYSGPEPPLGNWKPLNIKHDEKKYLSFFQAMQSLVVEPFEILAYKLETEN